MPFTLIHGFSGYLFSIPFTKNEKLRWLAFLGAMIADLDGLPLFYDFFFGTNYYSIIHRALFHPLIAGILFSIIAAYIAKKYLKVNKLKAFGFFFFGFLLHNLLDALFTNWPVKLFYPLIDTVYAYPALAQYMYPMYAIMTILFLVAIAPQLKTLKNKFILN